LDIFSRSGDIRDQCRKWGKIGQNFTEGEFFCEGPEFFGLTL